MYLTQQLNSGTTGFYRVHYPSTMLNEFLPSIRDKSMGSMDRQGILDDLFAVVKCGEVSTVEVLNLLKAYACEDDYNVWAAISTVVFTIQKLLGFTDYSDKFGDYIRNLYSPVKEKLGWDVKVGESKEF